MSQRRFIPHPDAERWDRVEIEVVERWKESELSGDEWRFSYVVGFWRHEKQVAKVSAGSMKEAVLAAAYHFSNLRVEGEPYMGDLSEVCCQPGCPEAWTVLLHPVKRYSKHGEELARPYAEDEVRGFCERHRYRGDCGLDDADDNYVLVEERFPPEWGNDAGQVDWWTVTGCVVVALCLASVMSGWVWLIWPALAGAVGMAAVWIVEEWRAGDDTDG